MSATVQQFVFVVNPEVQFVTLSPEEFAEVNHLHGVVTFFVGKHEGTETDYGRPVACVPLAFLCQVAGAVQSSEVAA